MNMMTHHGRLVCQNRKDYLILVKRCVIVSPISEGIKISKQMDLMLVSLVFLWMTGHPWLVP